jgi:DNA polymerase-1
LGQWKTFWQIQISWRKNEENVEATKKGLLSKTLTILLDCPVVFNETDYELSTPDVEKTDALF